MALTKADLRDRIGRVMEILVEGDDLSGYQAAQIDRAIDDVTERLAEDGVAYWDANSIPQALALVLRDYIASFVTELCSREVGLRLQAGRMEAYTELLRLTASPKPDRARADRSLLRMRATRRFR